MEIGAFRPTRSETRTLRFTVAGCRHFAWEVRCERVEALTPAHLGSRRRFAYPQIPQLVVPESIFSNIVARQPEAAADAASPGSETDGGPNSPRNRRCGCRGFAFLVGGCELAPAAGDILLAAARGSVSLNTYTRSLLHRATYCGSAIYPRHGDEDHAEWYSRECAPSTRAWARRSSHQLPCVNLSDVLCRYRLVRVQDGLKRVMFGRVVSDVVLPAAPDDVYPGSAEDAHSVWG